MSNNKDSHTWEVVVALVLVGLVLGIWVFAGELSKAYDAKFDQTVTYNIDPDRDKTLDKRGYSVTDLKMNQEAGFYSWSETLKYSGTLDKSVDTKYDTTNEVTIVKDLKSTDTNPPCRTPGRVQAQQGSYREKQRTHPPRCRVCYG